MRETIIKIGPLALLVAVLVYPGPASAQVTWRITDLGTLGGTHSLAAGINNLGQVVGTSNIAPPRVGEVHAFLWTAKDGMIDLGTLGGAWSEASGINNRGQVVGYSDTAPPVELHWPHAFLWTAEGGMVDLGTLPGYVISWASGINNRGQVVGTSLAPDCPILAVLWTRSR